VVFHPNDTLQRIREHEALWSLYTQKEEYSRRQLDRYGRPARRTNQDPLEPGVSKYLVDSGCEIEYPDGRQFAVCLTHDVDEIYPPLKHTLLSTVTCLKNLDLSGLRQQVFWWLHGKEQSPYWNFQEIMDLEEKYDARSSFYFLATDTDIKRFRYDIEDLEGELGRIVDRGWEVGLHGSYYAYNDLERILEEKGRLERVLGRKVAGYRNHYLRFCVPDSWEILEKAGFEYDTTLGYPDTVGFRNGMCHPFWPYNLLSDSEVGILEIPMVIMDGTLFDPARSCDEAWEVAKRLIETVADCQGVLTLNWHSHHIGCFFRQSWLYLYEKILQYCSRKNAWMTSGIEICKWWQYDDS
jgi:peptidoglycan/xylan/chitin deacetylase (PgdA/CDA1 family)